MDTGPGLIVEDEPVLGRNMRTFLRRHGYEAGHAESLAVARALDNDVHSDIVLVDHSLPDGTGLSFIEEIRKQDRWTKPVMITAHGGVKLAVFAMKVGAGDYLTKPASLDDIVLLVGKLIERSSIEGSLAYLAGLRPLQVLAPLERPVSTSDPGTYRDTNGPRRRGLRK